MEGAQRASELSARCVSRKKKKKGLQRRTTHTHTRTTAAGVCVCVCFLAGIRTHKGFNMETIVGERETL